MRRLLAKIVTMWQWSALVLTILSLEASRPLAHGARDTNRPLQHFDILIVGGRVLDGTGNPWFQADIGIRQGRIVLLRQTSRATASRTIDAHGKYVTPGFIDMHSHADDSIIDHNLRDPDTRYRAAPNLVAQGITTVVVNPDGFSPWPLSKQRSQLENKIGPNVAPMVGENTIRELVLGPDNHRTATPQEIVRMQAMVRQGMEDGAFGLTSGLEYPPSIWSTTDELVELVKELAPFGGFYSEHERSSGDAPMWWKPSENGASPGSVIDSAQEVIAIGERTGVPVVLTHIKFRGTNSWGTSRTLIELVDQARRRGVQVWADQYPYNSSSSDGDVLLIPGWAIGLVQENRGLGDAPAELNYAEGLRKKIEDPAVLEKVRFDIAHEIQLRGGPDNIVVVEYPDEKAVGKSLGQLARGLRITPVEMAIRLQLEGSARRPGGARLRGISLSEADVEALMSQPWVATSTDAEIVVDRKEIGAVHPRCYGTFPRKIRYYALDKKVISLEAAVRSSTSLPAQILGIHDRGQIQDGKAADLVVFDPDQIRDTSAFTDPQRYPEGIDDVLVNGVFVVDGGKLTGNLPGLVLRKEAPK
jgi:N-acyl-D-amino-acid deacylase